MKKQSFIVAFLFAAIAVISWIGCSGTDSAVAPVADSDPEVPAYFPLKTGNSLQFMEVDNTLNDTAYHWFTIGAGVCINEHQVYTWIEEISDRPAAIDTGYLFYENDAVYYFESACDIPEKLLACPLEVGSVWLRYDISETQFNDTNNLIDIITEYDDGKSTDGDGVQGGFLGDGTDDDGPLAAKCFPTIGANYFMISAVENLILDNGNHFEDCLKVENNAGDASNFYWYAPGVGLVKYVIGVDSESYPEGEVVGQIVLRQSD